MKFGENLKRLRKSKKLSQEELAEKVNVSRQSVSKWETGDAYPEINNILELCRIFHCNINELVNDSIIDVDSLDEETKMGIVKFKKEKQEKMKGLSRAIATISKICRVLLIISIPIIIITMIASIVLTNIIDYSDGIITIDGYNLEYKIEYDEVNSMIKVKDDKNVEVADYDNTLKTAIDFLSKHNKYQLLIVIEIGFCFLLIYIILFTKVLKHLEELFNNINGGDTPFTMNNVLHIKKMSYLLIFATILPSFVGIIVESLLDIDLDIGFELFNLLEILFLFSIAYIFEYGYEIQLDSNGKMYGDADE